MHSSLPKIDHLQPTWAAFPSLICCNLLFSSTVSTSFLKIVTEHSEVLVLVTGLTADKVTESRRGFRARQERRRAPNTISREVKELVAFKSLGTLSVVKG